MLDFDRVCLACFWHCIAFKGYMYVCCVFVCVTVCASLFVLPFVVFMWGQLLVSIGKNCCCKRGERGRGQKGTEFL